MAHDCINFDIWQLTLSTAKPWLLSYTSNSNFQLPADNLCLHTLLQQSYPHVPSPVNDIDVPFFFPPNSFQHPPTGLSRLTQSMTTTLPQTVTCPSRAALGPSLIITLLHGISFSDNVSIEEGILLQTFPLLQSRATLSTLRYSDGTLFKPQFTTFITVCLILGICMHGSPCLSCLRARTILSWWWFFFFKSIILLSLVKHKA